MPSQAIQATVFAAVRERIRFADYDLGVAHREVGFQVAFFDPPEEAADGLDVFLRHHSSIPFGPCSATSNLLRTPLRSRGSPGRSGRRSAPSTTASSPGTFCLPGSGSAP